jgi:hypothetical protein
MSVGSGEIDEGIGMKSREEEIGCQVAKSVESLETRKELRREHVIAVNLRFHTAKYYMPPKTRTEGPAYRHCGRHFKQEYQTMKVAALPK